MTDVTPPGDAPTPEELASSYLDDELDADERALVEADPALLALVEEHRVVRDAVAAPVAALSAARRDEMLAAAMAAAGVAGAGSNAVGGTVVALDRRRKARRWSTAVGAVAAAAVVALVLVVTRSGGDDTQTAGDASEAETALAASPTDAPADAGGSAGTVVDNAGQDADASSADTAVPPAAAAAPETSAPPGEEGARSAATFDGDVPDLGPLENRQAFIEAGRRFATTAPAAGQGPCPEYPPPLAKATFQGTPAYLVVIEATSAGNRVALVAVDTCASLVKADYTEG